MKKIILVLLFLGITANVHALTATMFGVDSVRPTVGNVATIGALVVIAGPEVANPFFITLYIDVDFSQTTNQIQTSMAAGIRAAILAQFGQTIPANGVNVMSFAKG